MTIKEQVKELENKITNEVFGFITDPDNIKKPVKAALLQSCLSNALDESVKHGIVNPGFTLNRPYPVIREDAKNLKWINNKWVLYGHGRVIKELRSLRVAKVFTKSGYIDMGFTCYLPGTIHETAIKGIFK